MYDGNRMITAKRKERNRRNVNTAYLEIFRNLEE